MFEEIRVLDLFFSYVCELYATVHRLEKMVGS